MSCAFSVSCAFALKASQAFVMRIVCFTLRRSNTAPTGLATVVASAQVVIITLGRLWEFGFCRSTVLCESRRPSYSNKWHGVQAPNQSGLIGWCCWWFCLLLFLAVDSSQLPRINHPFLFHRKNHLRFRFFRHPTNLCCRLLTLLAMTRDCQ